MLDMMTLHIASLVSNVDHTFIYALVNNGFSPAEEAIIAADANVVTRRFADKVRIIYIPKEPISDWRCRPGWPSCNHGSRTVAAVQYLHEQTDLSLGPSDVLWTLDADMFLLTKLRLTPEAPGKAWNIISVIFNRKPAPQEDDVWGAGARTACGTGTPRDCNAYYSYLWPNFALFTGFSGTELAGINFRPGFSDSGSMTTDLLSTPGLNVINSPWAGHDATIEHPWKLTSPDDATPWGPEVDRDFIRNRLSDASTFCFIAGTLPHCRFVAEQIAVMNAGAGCVRFSGLLVPEMAARAPAFVLHLGSATSNWRGCDESLMMKRLSDLQKYFEQQHPGVL